MYAEKVLKFIVTGKKSDLSLTFRIQLYFHIKLRNKVKSFGDVILMKMDAEDSEGAFATPQSKD